MDSNITYRKNMARAHIPELQRHQQGSWIHNLSLKDCIKHQQLVYSLHENMPKRNCSVERFKERAATYCSKAWQVMSLEQSYTSHLHLESWTKSSRAPILDRKSVV